MKTAGYRFHCFLHTLSPLHIAAPGNMRLNIDTLAVGYGDREKGIPCAGVQKLAVCVSGEMVRYVPVIAANNVMGRLRRHAAAEVLDVLSVRGERVRLQTYSAMTCGAVTGKPDGRDVMFDEYRETRAHPYIGLFGGGPRMLRRYARGYNAVPFMQTTRFMFERVRHPFLDEKVHFFAGNEQGLLQRWIFNRSDDLRELMNVSQAAASINDFEQELLKRQSRIRSEKQAAGENEADERHSTRTFSAFEFVIPGVCFPLSFDLDVSAAQLALFLLALDRFARVERLGGHVRNGFGQFALKDAVLTDAEGVVLADALFRDSRLDRTHAFIHPLLQHWEHSCAGLNAADLDRLFSPPPDKPVRESRPH